jgi:hypothetical protein
MYKKIILGFIDAALLGVLTLLLIAPAIFGIPFFALIAIQFFMTFGYFYLTRRDKKQIVITAISYPIFTVIIALLLNSYIFIAPGDILTFFTTLIGIILWINTILGMIIGEKLFQNRHTEVQKGDILYEEK